MSTPGCLLNMARNRFFGIFPIIRRIKESGFFRGARSYDVTLRGGFYPALVFLPEVAPGQQGTGGAFGAPGVADLAAVLDHLVGKLHPTLLGDEWHEVELDLHRVLFFGEPQALGDPAEMRVHKDTRHPEGVPQDHVGGLAAHPRQLHQLLQGPRHLAVEFFHQHLAEALDALGLVVKKAGGADHLFEIGQGGLGIVRGRGVFGKEGGGHLVHPDVRALRRQHRGHQHLQGILEIQGDVGLGIMAVQ